MKAKPTIEELRAGWWWQRLGEQFPPTNDIPEFPRPNELQVHWLLQRWLWGQDAAAFAYELARRAERRLKLKPYPELNDDEGEFLYQLFNKGKWRSDKNIMRMGSGNELHRSDPSFSSAVVFKLDLPTDALKQAFVRWIECQRMAYGIKPRPRESQTSKGPTWWWCEILDADRAGLRSEFISSFKRFRVLDAARTIREAQKRATQNLRTFKLSLLGQAEKYLWPEIRLVR